MPAYRRCGVRTTLWKIGILPWCNKHGFTHLGFFIMIHNKEGIRFYESLGFQACGYRRQFVNWEGKFLDALELEMKLK